jgi:hypothetical protein
VPIATSDALSEDAADDPVPPLVGTPDSANPDDPAPPTVVTPDSWNPDDPAPPTVTPDPSDRDSFKPGDPEYDAAMSEAEVSALEWSDTWKDCLGEWIESQKESRREPIVRALARFSVSCDKIDKRIVVDPPREYFTGTHVSVALEIRKGKLKAWLQFQYHASEWLFAERLKVAAGDYRWSSKRLHFDRDSSDTVWEVALIPYNKFMKGVLAKIVEEDDVVVRFIGSRGYDDFEVPPPMKSDLKLMFEALALLGK